MDFIKESTKIGIVKSLCDAIIVAEGLDRVFIGEVVSIKHERSDLLGMVLNIEGKITKIALIYGSEKEIRAGDGIWKTNKPVETKAGFGLIGRVVNPLGFCLNRNDIDTKEFVTQEMLNIRYVKIEIDAPGIIAREPVRRQLHTGVNAVDTMLPIGAGQRELVIGDLGSGKTTLVITIVLNQKAKNTHFWRAVERAIITQKQGLFLPCVYIVVGGRRSEMARVKRLLQIKGAMDYTVVVFTSADDLAALQYIAPYAGCAIGEWFRNNGYRALVVYDDLSIHAQAYRQVSLLLRRPPGREAYPGDIFYLHSRLLERAAQQKRDRGGGALTALPVVETKAGDISAYIPTNVISITDGQIFLSSKLANQGVRPAIDLNLSVSRVGSDAQPNMLKYVSKKTKLDYAVYRSFQGIEKISGDVDASILAFINRGKKIVAFFNQEVYVTDSLYKQVVCLHAISSGFLDKVNGHLVGYYFNLLLDLELSYTYLTFDLLMFLRNRRRLEIICQNFNFETIEPQVTQWLEEFSVVFDEVYGKQALQILGLN